VKERVAKTLSFVLLSEMEKVHSSTIVVARAWSARDSASTCSPVMTTRAWLLATRERDGVVLCSKRLRKFVNRMFPSIGGFEPCVSARLADLKGRYRELTSSVLSSTSNHDHDCEEMCR
jgi:hypothetical protein